MCVDIPKSSLLIYKYLERSLLVDTTSPHTQKLIAFLSLILTNKVILVRFLSQSHLNQIK